LINAEIEMLTIQTATYARRNAGFSLGTQNAKK